MTPISKGIAFVHFLGIAQSFGLFLLLCLAIGALLSLTMVALARIEASVVPVRRPDSSRARRAHPAARSGRACSYPPAARRSSLR